MDKKKDSMAGMTAAQKAAVLKGKQRMNKDEMAKLAAKPRVTPSLFNNWGSENSDRSERINKLGQGNTDMSKTIGRLESSKNRSETSAKYRLAKMKADNKARSAARRKGKMDPDAQPGFRPAPFLTKNKKKGK
jgi:hypothetical protein